MSSNNGKGLYFLNQVDSELQRAERYRIFISVSILDVGLIGKSSEAGGTSMIEGLIREIKSYIRANDSVANLGPDKVGLLFPETTRQGAEIASKRISEIIRTKISEISNERFDRVIPLEMASYPDAAGTKSIADFIKEYSREHVN